jgi:hypothetical protein
MIVVLRVRRNARFSQIFSRSTELRGPRFSTETTIFVPKSPPARSGRQRLA